MTGWGKYKQAEQNLENMKKYHPMMLQFQNEKSNFIHACVGLFNNLLEDYRKHYNLDITNGGKKKKNVKIDNFRRAAKISNNSKAVEFIDWYKNQRSDIKENPTFGFLENKRHEDEHEDMDNRIGINFSHEGKISNTEPTLIQPDFNDPSKMIFPENPNVSILQVCELYLQRLRQLILDAKQKANDIESL